jgi:hypothetical protein
MVMVVGVLKWILPSRQPLLLRLICEVTAGSLIYAAVVLIFHRDRALNFVRMAKSFRRSKA